MNKFTYTGPPKSLKKIPKKTGKSTFLIDECVFILNSSRPMNGLKRLNSPLTGKNNALFLHIEIIKAVCKKPEIVIVGGFNVKKLIKSPLRDEYIIVENNFYETSNSAEDLRLGLNASRGSSVFFINAEFIPSYLAYKAVLSDKTKSKVLIRREISQELGIEISDHKFVHHFSYVTQDKACGLYFFSAVDSGRLKKKLMGSSFDKRYFEYEMFDGIKMFPEYDIGNSIKIN